VEIQKKRLIPLNKPLKMKTYPRPRRRLLPSPRPSLLKSQLRKSLLMKEKKTSTGTRELIPMHLRKTTALLQLTPS
jgi:hypothetical protein